MRDLMAATKALADDNRVRTLMFLRSGELCVCQIMQALKLAPSTVSKHMAILHQARLVESRKDGRWVYYRLPRAPGPLVQGALEWIKRALKKDEQVLADARVVKAVRKMDKEKLCARYARGQALTTAAARAARTARTGKANPAGSVRRWR